MPFDHELALRLADADLALELFELSTERAKVYAAGIAAAEAAGDFGTAAMLREGYVEHHPDRPVIAVLRERALAEAVVLLESSGYMIFAPPSACSDGDGHCYYCCPNIALTRDHSGNRCDRCQLRMAEYRESQFQLRMDRRDAKIAEGRPVCLALRRNGEPCCAGPVRTTDRCYTHTTDDGVVAAARMGRAYGDMGLDEEALRGLVDQVVPRLRPVVAAYAFDELHFRRSWATRPPEVDGD